MAIYGVWLAIWPLAICIVYNHTSLSLRDYQIDITSFIILASIVALFPLLMGNYPVFLTNGVSFAAFLYFGLLVEIIVFQVAIIFLMVKLRIGKADFFRVPLNMVMFLVISILTASLYNALGGEHGSQALNSGSDVIPVFAYVIGQIVVNQIFLQFLSQYLYGRKRKKMIDQGMIWELLTTLCIAPIGFILYFVYTKIGSSAIYLIGIPFVLISITLRQFYKTSQVNRYLQKTGDIGHELTGSLGVQDVLDVFVNRVTKLLPIDYMYIFDVTSNHSMKLIRFYDRVYQTELPEIDLIEDQSISGDTWKTGKGKHYNSKKKWKHLINPDTPENVESVLSLPVTRQSKIVGVITIYATRHKAFYKYQYMILNILSNYLAVAIDNAKYYEKTKIENERCPLTSLYNYRYFEDYLQSIADDWRNNKGNQPVSQILLDIDHFKSVNDYFGHKAGNEILCQLARRLEAVIAERGVVARYGGEEFAVILPGYSSQEAVTIAEEIRQSVNHKSYVSYEHILSDNQPQNIDVTASFGVASYPEHCEDLLELTRQADRAMYIGAKRQGRDRVASYEKLKQAAE